MFRFWDVDQGWLLPPSLHEFMPAGQVVRFIRDTVREALDLSAILDTYTEERGYPPYHPGMMATLLLYGYSRGLSSSRQIARAREERGDVMAVTGLNRPDFRTIAAFRKRHLVACRTCSCRCCFVPVLRLCRAAGLVQFAHVVVDGTKLTVAHRLVTNSADYRALVPLADGMRAHLGCKPREVSGDAGFASEANLAALRDRGIAANLAPGRARLGEADASDRRRLAKIPLTSAMAARLKQAGRESRYRLRRQVVEPGSGR